MDGKQAGYLALFKHIGEVAREAEAEWRRMSNSQRRAVIAARVRAELPKPQPKWTRAQWQCYEAAVRWYSLSPMEAFSRYWLEAPFMREIVRLLKWKHRP